MRENLYPCVTIYKAFSKGHAFRRKSDQPVQAFTPFFGSSTNSPKTNFMKTFSSIHQPMHKRSNGQAANLYTQSIWHSLILMLALFIISTSCNPGKSESKSATNAPDIDIHTAVLTGNQDALKQHIAAGTNINEADPYGGSSPLISAAVFGKPEEARILIDAGADLNFQNNDGSTALHSAAFFCRPEIVKMLLEKGADKNITNKFGATPYMSVAGSFEETKPTYDVMGKVLGPMGLKLDYVYIEKTRPEIATLLK